MTSYSTSTRSASSTRVSSITHCVQSKWALERLACSSNGSLSSINFLLGGRAMKLCVPQTAGLEVNYVEGKYRKRTECVDRINEYFKVSLAQYLP